MNKSKKSVKFKVEEGNKDELGEMFYIMKIIRDYEVRDVEINGGDG